MIISETRRRRFIIVLAVIGALALIAVIVGGLMLLVAVRRGFSARDQPSRMETMLARSMRAWSIPSRAKRLTNPVQASAEVVAEARAHWADHCASCHGNNGSGDTAIGRNLYPKAPDMRAAATQEMSDGELYYIIENGIRLTGMPAWGQGRDDSEDSWKLVAFIRHLPSLTKDEVRQMERLNPKGPDQGQDEREEDEFLNGGGDQPTVPAANHAHHTH